MWRVNQTDLTSTSGNCMEACLASMLERPLDQIPYFGAATPDNVEDWSIRLQRWLADQGLFFIEVRMDLPEAVIVIPSSMLCMVSGPSPRYPGILHAVVGCTGGPGRSEVDLLHDPYYPEPIFFDGKAPKWIGFIGRRDIRIHENAGIQRPSVCDDQTQVHQDQSPQP